MSYPLKGTYKIPCSLAGKNVIIEVEVIDIRELPCILSMEMMKAANTVLGFNEDKVIMFSEEMDMIYGRSGNIHLQLELYMEEDGESGGSGDESCDEGDDENNKEQAGAELCQALLSLSLCSGCLIC